MRPNPFVSAAIASYLFGMTGVPHKEPEPAQTNTAPPPEPVIESRQVRRHRIRMEAKRK